MPASLTIAVLVLAVFVLTLLLGEWAVRRRRR